MDIFNIIQKVQDTGIHLEVDEEQWKITQGSSKGQAKWVWSPRIVDSHIQRIVLATEETTATQQVSHRPIKC